MANFKYQLPDDVSKENAESIINMVYTFQDIMAGLDSIEDEKEAKQAIKLYELQYLLQVLFKVDFPSLEYTT
jgi:hypothetical protein